MKYASWGCGMVVLLVTGLFVALWLLLAGSVPESYPTVDNPLPPPDPSSAMGGGLDGFASPYIGHTGSWDGKGGAMFGASKNGDLDIEVAMGLRWTVMCVYWKEMEPTGPVNLSEGVPSAWKSLDNFVMEAKMRKLNILMQAPVVGGNAGGPPEWAGRRQSGKSAPKNMEALVAFAGRLAERYCPGGTLATREGWGANYGVRAWELDNEPESYLTHWKDQAADYAEFVTKAAVQIKNNDPHALILTPASAAGEHGIDWIRQSLDAEARHGSPDFRTAGQGYSIGPVTDVVSFHNYEGLDTFFSGGDLTVTHAFQKVRSVFESWGNRSPGFEYPRKLDYWHTEGNFDFFGVLSEKRRAAWRFQFLTRAFAAGIRKVTIMDAKPMEQTAVKNYIRVLPNPFPMIAATDDLKILKGKAEAFRHPHSSKPDAGQVWVVWAIADTGDAVVELPWISDQATLVTLTGKRTQLNVENNRLQIRLRGDGKMPAPVLVIDRTNE
ncbi:MAG TPA: hypothetical protein EYG38_11220 [Verrucomicrobia bacterium]|nr:hypothetical protein [Verrucomicrobiota bacterium]